MTADDRHAFSEHLPSDIPRFSDERLRAIADRVGYTFINADIISRALTHPSASRQVPSENQRIEFLGDSVVALFTAHYLYRSRPDWDEGRCTSIKSVVVSTDSLSDCANELRLREFCRLGGDLSRRNDLPPSVGANLFEALVGAIYLDGGLEPAVVFLERMLIKRIDSACRPGADTNYKGKLQQVSQRLFRASPNYRLIRVKGSPHSRVFVVSADIGGQTFPSGEGLSKKAAEQEAARLALETIEPSEQAGTPEQAAEAPASGSTVQPAANVERASPPPTPVAQRMFSRPLDRYFNPLLDLDYRATRYQRAVRRSLRRTAGLRSIRRPASSRLTTDGRILRQPTRARIAFRRSECRAAYRRFGIR
ncbi:MAG: ribonuclease III [Planctomycetota bacterium]